MRLYRSLQARRMDAMDDELPSITCPVCKMTSYSPKDIEYRYCGNCHQFHEVMSAGVEKMGEFIEKGRGRR